VHSSEKTLVVLSRFLHLWNQSTKSTLDESPSTQYFLQDHASVNNDGSKIFIKEVQKIKMLFLRSETCNPKVTFELPKSLSQSLVLCLGDSKSIYIYIRSKELPYMYSVIFYQGGSGGKPHAPGLDLLVPAKSHTIHNTLENSLSILHPSRQLRVRRETNFSSTLNTYNETTINQNKQKSNISNNFIHYKWKCQTWFTFQCHWFIKNPSDLFVLQNAKYDTYNSNQAIHPINMLFISGFHHITSQFNSISTIKFHTPNMIKFNGMSMQVMLSNFQSELY